MSTDTTSLDADVAALKAAHAAATRQRVRAEQARDTADAMAAALRNQLKNEFGADTLDEAETHLDQLNSQLTEAITRLRQQLTEAGGTL